ncbi:Autotransporter beta-domain-containing protein [Bradyrhizobium erythrophlei]|uniref:Autotransporter beta-domain-containing protein n=1 Tax=Bradyrhizobium erythrophlei TaxID=1437360 RepID=A0A1M5QMA4_9BRAD|nr:autotransporter outer membrane beta-barrel domain-containing protein [Bradyrhizobium erythrophlei]SHH15235.1 Autotransporter beta-domain-containing protein [Bradyrhizobium erythrophlei]
MCCSPQPARSRERGAGRGVARAVAIVFGLMLAAAVASSPAHAQSPSPTPTPNPTPSPSPTPLPSPSPTPTSTSINSDLSAGATVTNLGSNFLERLGSQASSGFGRGLRTNPGGGGASEATDAPRFRTWGEAYGISVNTGAQADFVGDHRQTWGGVAGLGAMVAPGVNLGVSVDQSRTAIDVPLALQSATLDLTQFGFNASVDNGPWTWAVALVHGFGKINSSRDTGFGTASAGYNARIDGALTELSYYWNIDQSRIVPKAALEYVRATTGSFQEVGGLDQLMATGTSVERSRILLGAEVGHYWILDQKIFDLSAYGKFVDNTSQNFSSITVSLGAESITVQGIGESRYGADAGASASLSLSNTARLYLNYDAKFRAALQSHQGTLGVELKF